MKNNLPSPHWQNFYLQEKLIKKIWAALFQNTSTKDYEELFTKFGSLGVAASELSATVDKKTPELFIFNSVGERICKIAYHPDYLALKKLSYGEGIISKKYSLNHPYPHLFGFVLGHYFAHSEIGLYCPICMTDALAYTLKKYAPQNTELIERLTTSDLKKLYEGAMFLTEKHGGSDVGANTVQATYKDNKWFLSGNKWFCSNADAEVILVLAKMPETKLKGTKGLGLFLIQRNFPAENFKKINILRLKDKLGVRSMASGEIDLEEVEATLIGGENLGFKQMTAMVNLSRLYTAVAAISGTKRALIEAYFWGFNREAFGKKIKDHPLWALSLFDLITEYIGLHLLTFSTAKHLDLAESGQEESAHLCRILTPIVKALTGKFGVFAASESMELIGGNAYIEDTPLPRILRDLQVLPIWEGTTNIQSLDFLRALSNEQSVKTLLTHLESLCSGNTTLESELTEYKSHLLTLIKSDPKSIEMSSKSLLEKTGRLFSKALLYSFSKNDSLQSELQICLENLEQRESLTSPLASFHGNTDLKKVQLLIQNFYTVL